MPAGIAGHGHPVLLNIKERTNLPGDIIGWYEQGIVLRRVLQVLLAQHGVQGL
jgi:hypothetical protein